MHGGTGSRGGTLETLRRRAGPGALCVVAPFTALLCGFRWEVAATAACFAVIIVPGVLLTERLFPRDHPLAGFPARFGLASALGIGLLGIATFFATKLHWRFPTFLALYGGVWLAALIFGVTRLRKAQPEAERPDRR